MRHIGVLWEMLRKRVWVNQVASLGLTNLLRVWVQCVCHVGMCVCVCVILLEKGDICMEVREGIGMQLLILA